MQGRLPTHGLPRPSTGRSHARFTQQQGRSTCEQVGPVLHQDDVAAICHAHLDAAEEVSGPSSALLLSQQRCKRQRRGDDDVRLVEVCEQLDGTPAWNSMVWT